MFGIILYFILFLFYIYFYAETFQAKNAIHKVYRNFIVARILMLLIFTIPVSLFAASYILYRRLDNPEIVIYAILSCLVLFSTAIEYKLHGEGVYEEGAILSGIFYRWTIVTDSKITDASGKGKVCWTLLSKDFTGRPRAATIRVSPEEAEKFHRYAKIRIEEQHLL